MNQPAGDDELERIWQAMLVVFPTIARQNLKHAPQGVAQLCHEHAHALVQEFKKVQEWKKIQNARSSTESTKGAENG